MRNILYSKDDVEIYTQYNDVILFTPHLMVFKEDTPENRKAIFDIAGVEEENHTKEDKY